VPDCGRQNTISFDFPRKSLRYLIGMVIAMFAGGGSEEMKYHYLSGRVGRIVAALFFLVSIGLVSSSAVQAQYWPNQDRNRDYRRDRDDDRYRRDRQNDDWRRRNNGGYGNGGYNNYSQMAYQQGYQDGIYTGQSDGQRGQNYNPQRSHFYRNGHGDGGGYYGNNGRYGNGQFQQAYRQGFLQGYDQGYRSYRGSRNRRNSSILNRWPF
jgi:hypothetical protein